MSYTSRDDGYDELFFSVGWLKMGVIWTFVSSLIAGLGALLVYMYFARKGSFNELEDVKYQMFRIDEKKVNHEDIDA